MTTQDRTRRRIAIVGALITIGLVYYVGNRARTALLDANTVVAWVNGEAISALQVNRGFSRDSFDSTANDMKQQKVERLITQVATRQFLGKHGVHVQAELVDKEIAKMERNPPSLGCPCCTYASLGDYLLAIGDTREDLRLEIESTIGLSDYARTSWRKSHPDKSAVLREVADQSTYIRQRYIKAWQIFFNTFQQPGYNSDPGKVTRAAARKAQAAWDRLQRGEPFEAVVRSVSEDMTSNHKGGSLGFVERSSYGREVQAAVAQLEPGQYSKPIQSSWGYHIIKWEPMSDADIVEFCESYFVDKELKTIQSQIMKGAKVERPQSSDRGS